MTEPTEASVRAEVRAWLEANWNPDLGLVEWRNRLIDSGWGAPSWPKAVVRPRPAAGAGRRRRPGDAARRRGRRRPRRRAQPRGRDAARPRQRSPEGEVPAPQPDRRRQLVPAVQRAGQRLRPRRRHDPGRAQGQPLGVNGQKVWTTSAHHADWGLLLARTDWNVPEAPGAVLLRARHAPAGRRGAAAAADERPRLVQPGVLHRRRGPARAPGRRARRRLGGGDHDADARAPRRRRHRRVGRARTPSRRARAASTTRSGPRSPPPTSPTSGTRSAPAASTWCSSGPRRPARSTIRSCARRSPSC